MRKRINKNKKITIDSLSLKIKFEEKMNWHKIHRETTINIKSKRELLYNLRSNKISLDCLLRNNNSFDNSNTSDKKSLLNKDYAKLNKNKTFNNNNNYINKAYKLHLSNNKDFNLDLLQKTWDKDYKTLSIKEVETSYIKDYLNKKVFFSSFKSLKFKNNKNIDKKSLVLTRKRTKTIYCRKQLNYCVPSKSYFARQKEYKNNLNNNKYKYSNDTNFNSIFKRNSKNKKINTITYEIDKIRENKTNYYKNK